MDIVEVDRFRGLYERWGDRFIDRLFTPWEVDYARDKRDAHPYYASRFAAKEAFVKALGTGFNRGVSWMDIEVRRKEGHRPFFNITGRAFQLMEQAGAGKAHLSISHEKSYAVAQVILED